MYYEPEQLKGYLVRSLRRLSEDDSIEAIRILSQRLLDLRNSDYYLTIPVEDLPLSTKSANALLFNQLLNVREVIQYGFDRLILIRGIGPQTLEEIRTVIDRVTEKKDQIRGLSGYDLRKTLSQLG